MSPLAGTARAGRGRRVVVAVAGWLTLGLAPLSAAPLSAATARPVTAPPADCSDTTTLERLCSCLEEALDRRERAGGGGAATRMSCELSRQGAATAVAVVERQASVWQRVFYLAARRGESWQAVALLGEESNSGAGGGREELELRGVSELPAPGGTVVWAETLLDARDLDLRSQEEWSSERLTVTLCWLPDDTTRPVACPLQVPLETTVSRTNLARHDPLLPPDEVVQLAIRLGGDPRQVEVGLVEGELAHSLVPLLGRHDLAVAAGPGPPSGAEVHTAGEQEVAVIETGLGTMVFRLLEDGAPLTTRNFKRLVHDGFYDGKEFYRVVAGHVIQAGDGGDNDHPTVPGEFGAHRHVRGALGLARDADPDSGSTEIYVCHAPRPHLDGSYAVFGLLVEGFEVLDAIATAEVEERWEGEVAFHRPKSPVVIERVRIERR